MFGRLTIEALPLYSAIAAGGAAMVVGGALLVAIVITWLKGWLYLWNEWLTSVDHKRIGVMYIVLALIMLLRGFVDAIMMRAQQAMALNNERLPAARAFRPDLQLARHDHDLLHGHAVHDRAAEHRRAAADRHARRRLPVPELAQPVARRRRAPGWSWCRW